MTLRTRSTLFNVPAYTPLPGDERAQTPALPPGAEEAQALPDSIPVISPLEAKPLRFIRPVTLNAATTRGVIQLPFAYRYLQVYFPADPASPISVGLNEPSFVVPVRSVVTILNGIARALYYTNPGAAYDCVVTGSDDEPVFYANR